MTLALLLTAVGGAWADETPLLTIESKDYTSFLGGSKTFDNKVTVTFSNSVYNDGDEYGWYAAGGTPSLLTVAGTNGYTITSCKFYTKAGTAETGYTIKGESPSVYLSQGQVYTDDSKSVSIGSIGITKIEVYSAAASSASGPTIDVKWDAKAQTGTFEMPGSDVVLTPIYASTAVFATDGNQVLIPTAIEGIYAESTDAIVKAGTVAKIGETENPQGTLMYAVTSTNEAKAPELTAFSATLPTAKDITAAGDVYVWYYIKGADAPEGETATAENTFNDSEICETPLTVTVLNNKFDIQFKAANANTIEAGKATVTVGGTDKTSAVTEGKLEGVKMGSEVKLEAKKGYIIESATAKQKEGETTVTVTIADGNGEASFQMPQYDVTATYTLKRDMTVDVAGEMADRIRIQMVGNAYQAVDATQMNPVVKDNLETNSPVTLTVTTDYTLQLQKQSDTNADEWTDATALSVGTFRYKITGAGNYSGICYSEEFALFQGYEVTVPAGECVTYYKDEALYVEDENAELYTIASVTATEAQLSSKIEVAPANTPLLVYNKSTEDKTFLLIPTTDKQPAEVAVAKEFKGTLTAGEIPASTTSVDYYALNGKAFVWVKYAIEIGANKCWLQIGNQPATTRANTRSITGGGDTTGIDAVDSEQRTDDSYYDLQGRKVLNPTKKGIYIKNGKKVVVRK